MNYAPLARIAIRYGVGIVLGADAANILALDPDLVSYVAAGIGMAVEILYAAAVKRGWAR